MGRKNSDWPFLSQSQPTAEPRRAGARAPAGCLDPPAAGFQRGTAAEMYRGIHVTPLAALLERIREQYREMPDLTLTKLQATELFQAATLGERQDAECARHEERSVPPRRGRVCAIAHPLTSSPQPRLLSFGRRPAKM